MTIFHKTNNGILAITKGTVDVLFGKLVENQKSNISEFEYKTNKMDERGYRVLGFALRMIPQHLKIPILGSLWKLMEPKLPRKPPI